MSNCKARVVLILFLSVFFYGNPLYWAGSYIKPPSTKNPNTCFGCLEYKSSKLSLVCVPKFFRRACSRPVHCKIICSTVSDVSCGHAWHIALYSAVRNAFTRRQHRACIWFISTSACRVERCMVFSALSSIHISWDFCFCSEILRIVFYGTVAWLWLLILREHSLNMNKWILLIIYSSHRWSHRFLPLLFLHVSSRASGHSEGVELSRRYSFVLQGSEMHTQWWSTSLVSRLLEAPANAERVRWFSHV